MKMRTVLVSSLVLLAERTAVAAPQALRAAARDPQIIDAQAYQN